MKEELKYDSELDTLIRFRGSFIMPNWDGVEDNELDYVVDSPWERLDNLAAKMWGEDKQELWWVIAARNNIDLPSVQLYKGKRLRIPNRQWVIDKLLPQFRQVVEKMS